MKVLPFPERRRAPELDNLSELLAGRLQTWSELLRLGAGPGAVLAEMEHFLERTRRCRGDQYQQGDPGGPGDAG